MSLDWPEVTLAGGGSFQFIFCELGEGAPIGGAAKTKYPERTDTGLTRRHRSLMIPEADGAWPWLASLFLHPAMLPEGIYGERGVEGRLEWSTSESRRELSVCSRNQSLKAGSLAHP